MKSPRRQGVELYEERVRDQEKVEHGLKMQEADRRLADHSRKIESARRLYEERVHDSEH